MGFYINPPDMTKEDFLRKFGRRLHAAPDVHRECDAVVVCLVDNGAFTAAGIAYDQRELETMKHPDGRRKEWWHVPLVYLEPYMRGHPIAEASD